MPKTTLRRVQCAICEDCRLNIQDVLERIDIPIIQKHFLSKEALAVLKIYEGREMSFHGNIVSLITNQCPPSEMLRQKSTRTMLFKMLHPEEADELVKELFSNWKGDNPYDQLARTRFAKNGEQERVLFNFFNMVPPMDIHAKTLSTI